MGSLFEWESTRFEIWDSVIQCSIMTFSISITTKRVPQGHMLGFLVFNSFCFIQKGDLIITFPFYIFVQNVSHKGQFSWKSCQLSSTALENIRRFYGKRTGNQPPVHFPLVLKAPINIFSPLGACVVAICTHENAVF